MNIISKDTIKEENKNPHALSYFNLLRISSLVDMRLKSALKPYNITHSQLNVLSILAKCFPDPMTSKSIKEKLIVANPDITRLLDRMVEKRFVIRKTCPTNRREIDISATEDGVEFFYEVHLAAKEALNNYFEDCISNEEAKVLSRILRKIKV